MIKNENNQTLYVTNENFEPVTVKTNGTTYFEPNLVTKTGTELEFENTYNSECELIKVYGDSYQENNKIAVKTGNIIQFDDHKGDYMVVKSCADCTVTINNNDALLQADIWEKFDLISGINIITSELDIEVQYLKSDTVETEDSDLTSPTPNFPETINCVNGTLTSSKGDLSSSITIPNLYAIRDSSGNVVAQDILYIDKEQKRMWVEKYFYEKIFTGTENWYYASSTIIGSYGLTVTDLALNTYNTTSVYCENYRSIHVNERYIDKTTFVNTVGIVFYDVNLININNWKSYLTDLYNNNTPLTVILQLENPIIEELDYQTLKTFPKNTMFTTNSELKPQLEINLLNY